MRCVGHSRHQESNPASSSLPCSHGSVHCGTNQLGHRDRHDLDVFYTQFYEILRVLQCIFEA